MSVFTLQKTRKLRRCEFASRFLSAGNKSLYLPVLAKAVVKKPSAARSINKKLGKKCKEREFHMAAVTFASMRAAKFVRRV